jgi:hypothetical protein
MHPAIEREVEMSQDPKQDYEAPTVEEVNTDDDPAVTAAGADTQVDGQESDLRLKRSLRPLEGTHIRLIGDPSRRRCHE